MTFKEKVLLMKYDLMLLEHADRMVCHIENVYDFAASTEPLDEWWWHLDQVVSGELEVEIARASNKERA